MTSTLQIVAAVLLLVGLLGTVRYGQGKLRVMMASFTMSSLVFVSVKTVHARLEEGTMQIVTAAATVLLLVGFATLASMVREWLRVRGA